MYIGQMLKSVVHTYADGTTETIVEVVSWIEAARSAYGKDRYGNPICIEHTPASFGQTCVSSWDY